MKRYFYVALKQNLKLLFFYFKAKKSIKNKDFKTISTLAKKIIDYSNLSIEIRGYEKIENIDKAVFFANHCSYYDPLFFMINNSNISFVQKEELSKIKILKDYASITNGEFIDRSNVRTTMQSIINLNKLLKENDKQLVCIFPEGTRNKTDSILLEFKPGSFKLGSKEKVPLVPVAIIGAKNLDNSSDKKHIIIQYLNPITYEDYKDLKTNELADLVKKLIQETIEREAI